MKKMNLLFAVMMAFAVVAADAQAGCGGGFSVSYSSRGGGSCGGCGGGYHGGHGGGHGGGYYGGNPYYRFPGVGHGQVAFRRGRRLSYRSRRAARWGFHGRSNRLAWRANAAYGRGHRRARGWY